MLKLQDIQKRSCLSLEDLVKLEDLILSTGWMTPEKAREEIERFIVKLGIDDYYFKTTSIDEIAKHLLAISASELVSKYGGEGMGIQLITEHEDKAVYIVEDQSSKTEEIEQRIEDKYPLFRLESYRMKHKTGKAYLRLYMVTRPVYKKRSNGKRGKLSFEDVMNEAFMQRSAPETVARYKDAWESMNHRESPYIAASEKVETRETRVMVGIHGQGSRQFLKNFSHLLDKYGIYSNRKYREPLADGKQIYSFYFNKMDPETAEEFSRDLNAVVMLPDNRITTLFLKEIFSAQQTLYAQSAAAFTHQFLTVLTEEYISLTRALKDQPEAQGILDTLKLRLIKDTYSETRIAQTVLDHHDIVALLYNHFAGRLHPKRGQQDLKELEDQINTKIEKDVPSMKDRTILRFFLTFNNAVLKTNFFMRDKTCMAYSLDTSVVNEIDFPERPFGLYFFYGREFIGFHVRFRDIARGGVRIIKSRNLTWYEHNLDTLFMENYNLALTQQKKNKDIPEGGSKGTILLKLENQAEEERAFKSYIDGLVDLIMPNEEVLDLYGKDEIIFLGPDERTAHLMNWAALYAKRRHYPFWKAFTTGKSPELGGIPHDQFGMTTAGIHEYVLAILEKLNLREEGITKIQTGGPDGDLGSNEILVSKDKTLAVIDGSGVLYDPVGINKQGLIALARKRRMVEDFDRSLLSPHGFFVSINDKEVKLPDGTVVLNGEDFRNNFHLHPLAKADLFVPCGGRPGAININNWHRLLDERGKPKFRIIVEGANLFITEEARLRLEEHGIIIIKDASANKGGVTSSSLEVFASLALSDDEYEKYMMVKDGEPSEFRKAYVEEILATIKRNARLEFDLLWREHERRGLPFTTLSNMVSKMINDATDAVYISDLTRNGDLKRKVVMEYAPGPLLELVGIDRIMERVPPAYLNAIMATKIATNYVYTYGLGANAVDFFNYMKSLEA
jgi:glutamate dehydrogenase